MRVKSCNKSSFYSTRSGQKWVGALCVPGRFPLDTCLGAPSQRALRVAAWTHVRKLANWVREKTQWNRRRRGSRVLIELPRAPRVLLWVQPKRVNDTVSVRHRKLKKEGGARGRLDFKNTAQRKATTTSLSFLSFASFSRSFTDFKQPTKRLNFSCN